MKLKETEKIIISYSQFKQSIIGYSEFMCNDCRTLRHADQVHDIYNSLN